LWQAFFIGSSQVIFSVWIYLVHVFWVDYYFFSSCIVYKIQLVDKGYGINLQHYLTSSFVPYKTTQLWPLLFCFLFVQMKINKFHSFFSPKIYFFIKSFQPKYQVIWLKMHLNLHYFLHLNNNDILKIDFIFFNIFL